MRRMLACRCILGWAMLYLAGPARADTGGWLAVWYGTYVFDGSGGRTFGGSPIIYNYTLTLRPGPNARACTVVLEGYQEDETLRCSIAGDRALLRVAFASYANGSTENAYGVQVYPPGALLFRLSRGGETRSLTTTWLALHPDGVAETGTFFRRTGH